MDDNCRLSIETRELCLLEESGAHPASFGAGPFAERGFAKHRSALAGLCAAQQVTFEPVVTHRSCGVSSEGRGDHQTSVSSRVIRCCRDHRLKASDGEEDDAGELAIRYFRARIRIRVERLLACIDDAPEPAVKA